MDDFSIDDERLTDALADLRMANRRLGGYGALWRALRPHLDAHGAPPLHVLDVGTGTADVPAELVRRADRAGLALRATGLDANPVTLAHAGHYLDDALAPALRPRVALRLGDALAIDAPDGAYDVVTASLFLHHFEDAEAVALLAEMQRVARLGILVSDLHRHPVAYVAFVAGARLGRRSAMFAHDGAVSIRRGFRRAELEALADRAGLRARVRWHWAFRWLLSTLPASR